MSNQPRRRGPMGGGHGRMGMQSPESAEHLCGKCDLYAAEWKKAADELWAENPHHKQRYENYKKENLDEEAKASTEEILFGIRG